MSKRPIKQQAYFEVYRATDETRSQRWYWRLKAPNNRILAVGGEPFLTRRKCVESVRRVQRYAQLASLALEKVPE